MRTTHRPHTVPHTAPATLTAAAKIHIAARKGRGDGLQRFIPPHRTFSAGIFVRAHSAQGEKPRGRECDSRAREHRRYRAARAPPRHSIIEAVEAPLTKLSVSTEVSEACYHQAADEESGRRLRHEDGDGVTLG